MFLKRRSDRLLTGSVLSLAPRLVKRRGETDRRRGRQIARTPGQGGKPAFFSREAPSVEHGRPRRAIPLQGPAGAQLRNGHVPANHLWCRYIKQKKRGDAYFYP